MMKLQVVDSHTAGEPTRLVLAGGPALVGSTVAELAADFAANHDHIRRAVVLEPRGSDVLVGAWLVPSAVADAGIIFFNNVGLLGMCGHGLIGVVESLLHVGRLHGNSWTIETPVGMVPVQRRADGSVSLQNVPSFRLAGEIAVDVPGFGRFTGDVAWGGNWFYLVEDHREALHLSNVERLLQLAKAIKVEIVKQFTQVDHVELFGPPGDARNDARNFVLCPGNAYDRSPCGTGTSAKLACLAARGKLGEGATWRQESILGTVFEASYASSDETIVPTIAGRAFVTAEATLLLHPDDPFRFGMV